MSDNNNNDNKKRKSCEEPAPSESIAKVHAAIVHYFSSRYKNVEAPADASGSDKVDSVSNRHVQVIFNSLFIAEEAYEDDTGECIGPYPRLVKVFNIPTSALYKFHAWFLDFAMGAQQHPQVKKLLRLFFSGWGCLDRTVSPTENKKLQEKVQKLFAKLDKSGKVSDFSVDDVQAYVVGFNKYFAEHQFYMGSISSPLSIRIEKVYVFLRGNRFE